MKDNAFYITTTLPYVNAPLHTGHALELVRADTIARYKKLVGKNGFIYKKNYEAKYCIGCESEKTDSELENGECKEHPGVKVSIISEENYFFKYSAFRDKLLDFYEKNPNFIVPDFRFNEIKTFVKNGLQDFSISRLKSKMPWGIPVPDDNEHVMYVWFDALVNYISTLGWPENEE